MPLASARTALVPPAKILTSTPGELTAPKPLLPSSRMLAGLLTSNTSMPVECARTAMFLATSNPTPAALAVLVAILGGCRRLPLSWNDCNPVSMARNTVVAVPATAVPVDEGCAPIPASSVIWPCGSILASVIGHHRRRDDGDDCASQDIAGNRVAGAISGEEGGGDERRRATGDDRGELIAERRAAVAQAPGEGFRDQRRLRPVHHVVRDEREHDGDEDQGERAGVEEGEVQEAEDTDRHRADQVHLLAPDEIGDVAGERDRDEGEDRGGHHRVEQEIARHLQRADPVGEDERREDVERRLLGQAHEGREDDLLGMLNDHREHGLTLDLLLGQQLREDRRLENAEADIEADADEHDAEGKRNPPSPDDELVAGKLAERQEGEVGKEEAARHAELRPRRDEAARAVGARPLHRQQYRAAPFAADPDALDKAQEGQDDGAPDADRLVARDESDDEGGDAHQHEGRDQRRLAADAVAIVAEDRRTDRPRGESRAVDEEGIQRSDQRIGVREEQFGEDQAGGGAVEEEIIPLDCRADRTCDDRATQLGTVFHVR